MVVKLLLDGHAIIGEGSSVYTLASCRSKLCAARTAGSETSNGFKPIEDQVVTIDSITYRPAGEIVEHVYFVWR